MKRRTFIVGASVVGLSFLTGCGINSKNIGPDNVAEPANGDSSTVMKPQEEAALNQAVDGILKVYMTTDISPQGLKSVYNALDREATGRVAVKISTGEPGGHNFCLLIS